jgi:hypothetical protein
MRIQPCEGGVHGVTARETSHSHVVGRSFAGVVHVGSDSSFMLTQGSISPRRTEAKVHRFALLPAPMSPEVDRVGRRGDAALRESWNWPRFG